MNGIKRITGLWKRMGAALLILLLAAGLLAGCGSPEADRALQTAAAEVLEEALAEAEAGTEAEVKAEAEAESQERAEAKAEATSRAEAQDKAEGKAGAEAAQAGAESGDKSPEADAGILSEDGTYTTKDEVALYLHTYGHLPDNYITKKEAQKLGWDSKKGNLEDVAPGKSIGGSHFGNYEGQLPEKDGRKYYECDLNYEGSYRGEERLIYSNDGLIFYTGDHYETFEQLY